MKKFGYKTKLIYKNVFVKKNSRYIRLTRRNHPDPEGAYLARVESGAKNNYDFSK